MAKDQVKKSFIFPQEIWGEIEAAIKRDGLKPSTAARVALLRYARQKKRPTTAEIEEAKLPTGNPNIADLNRRRADDAK